MNTAKVNAALRSHYKTNEYALMFEVGNTTGSAVTRHADAVVMNLWPSRGLLIEGIEVKVSRSDWTRELKNPAKAEVIAQYCDKWWIVAPVGIVHEHEVPALWGYKTVSETGQLRTVKDAPRNDDPTPLTRGFVAAMLRRASEADAAIVDALVNKRIASERNRIEDEVTKRVDRATRAFNKIQATVDKLKELGLDLTGYWGADADEIIACYKLGKRLRRQHEFMGFGFTADNLEKAAILLREVDTTLKGEASI